MTPRAALDRGLGELALALPSGAPEKMIERRFASLWTW